MNQATTTSWPLTFAVVDHVEGQTVVDQTDRFETLLLEATHLNAVDKFPEAIERARAAAALAPHDYRPLCEWARALYGQREFSEAVEVAQAATQVAPLKSWPFRLLADSLTAKAMGLSKSDGKLLISRAVEAANDAVRLAPYDASCQRCLAQVMSVADQPVQANSAMQEAIRLDPINLATWVAASLVAIRAKNWNAAVDASNRALSIEPNNSAALNNLGVALRGSGRRSEGIEVLASAARNDPSSTTSRGNLSRAGLNSARITVMVLLIPLGFVTHSGLALYWIFAIVSNIVISKNPKFVMKMEGWAVPLALFVSRKFRFRAPHAVGDRDIPATQGSHGRWTALGYHYRIRTSVVRLIAIAVWLCAASLIAVSFVASGTQRDGLWGTALFFVLLAWPPTAIVRRRTRQF